MICRRVCWCRIGRRCRLAGSRCGSLGSAEAFEAACGGGEGGCHGGEFGVARAVVRGGFDVLGGAAKLEEPVLQVGEFGGGEDDGVIGQAAALDGGAAFVGALPAGLSAVLAGAADAAGVGQAAAAPAAVAGGAAGPDRAGGVAGGVAGPGSRVGHGGGCGVHGVRR